MSDGEGCISGSSVWGHRLYHLRAPRLHTACMMWSSLASYSMHDVVILRPKYAGRKDIWKNIY